MKKVIIFFIILIISGGYYLYEKKKEKDLAKLICSEHFDTSEKICLEEYWNYSFRLASKIAKKNLSEYKNKVNEIEKKISNLKLDYVNEDFNPLEYEPLTYSGLGMSQNFNKVIIIGQNTGKFFEPSCRVTYDYQVCLISQSYDYNNDKEVIYSEIVKINNIEKFKNIKSILDKLHSYNFRYYKMTVYGDLKKSIPNSTINADFIKLERVNEGDEKYETALASGIYVIKHKEFEKFFKKKFPNKNIPKLTNSVLYK